MKRILYTLFVSFLIVGFQSCSEDFEVAAPYKNITFVYGFLDMNDTAHYIRIQKAFLDENKSAIEMAQVADSSFYNNIIVTLREINGSVISKNITLNKVDLLAEGYPKDSGAFFNSPSYAYKFTNKLDSFKRYRLVIQNPITGVSDSSEIDIINANRIYLKFNAWDKMNFAMTMPLAMNKWSTFLWYKPYSNVKYVEMYVKFNWEDREVSTGNLTRKSAFLKIDERNTNATNYDQFTKVNQEIYTFLRNEIGDAPTGVERLLDSVDYYYYVGGSDYSNYLDKKNIQNGLVGDQSKPIFTNILGKDIYGLFSTRSVIYRPNIPIDSMTLDSLIANPITNSLKIRGFTND